MIGKYHRRKLGSINEALIEESDFLLRKPEKKWREQLQPMIECKTR